MRRQKMFIALAALLSLGATLFLAGCGGSGGGGDTSPRIMLSGTETNSGTPSTPDSDRDITPYTIDTIDGKNNGGNRTCADVGEAFFDDPDYYEFTSDRVEYDGEFDASFPTGISVYTDGTYVDWTSTFGIGAVIVKGGNAANVYVYEPQGKSDSDLAAPPNKSGYPAGLGNLTFCWNPEEEACFEYETAWAAGTRYTTQGNWATYASYDGTAKSEILYAGQTIDAGTVTFSAEEEGEVTITITLNTGFKFDDQDPNKENVHIQGYSTAPSGNPAPGQFAYKAIAEGTTHVAKVGSTGFYGVHVVVGVPVDCPEE